MNISVCIGSSCHLRGSYDIIQKLKELIAGEKLEDKVNLNASFCLGQCTHDPHRRGHRYRGDQGQH